MSPQTTQCDQSAVPAGHLPAFVEALATVHAQLVAIPRQEVPTCHDVAIGGDDRRVGLA